MTEKQPTQLINSVITPQTLTERQAAIYVGMSIPFLRQSRVDGNRTGHTPAPPWLKIGRSVRYMIDDLDQWLQSNRFSG